VSDGCMFQKRAQRRWPEPGLNLGPGGKYTMMWSLCLCFPGAQENGETKHN
jgi:hypothetical protein